MSVKENKFLDLNQFQKTVDGTNISSYITQKDLKLKRQMAQERRNIARLKSRMQETRVKEGIQSQKKLQEQVIQKGEGQLKSDLQKQIQPNEDITSPPLVISSNRDDKSPIVQSNLNSGEHLIHEKEASPQPPLQNSALRQSTEQYNTALSKREQDRVLTFRKDTMLASQDSEFSPSASVFLSRRATAAWNPKLLHSDMQSSMMSSQMISPKRQYMVGKYKDYRKLVGLEQVKAHAGPAQLNMSQKRRATLERKLPPPTRELSLNKVNRHGANINDAIDEIIHQLELNEHNQNEQKLKEQEKDGTKSKPVKPVRVNALNKMRNQDPSKTTTQPYLLRHEKQKILDRFIDLSTADVFNRANLIAASMNHARDSNMSNYTRTQTQSSMYQGRKSSQFGVQKRPDGSRISQINNVKFARGSTRGGSVHGETRELMAINSKQNMGQRNMSAADGLTVNSPTDIMTKFSFKNQQEYTLSLPQMGPNFNFYKFRGVHEVEKSKYKQTQKNLQDVDRVLTNCHGQNLNSNGDSIYGRFGSNVMDNKGISPLTQSPRAEDEKDMSAINLLMPTVQPLSAPKNRIETEEGGQRRSKIFQNQAVSGDYDHPYTNRFHFNPQFQTGKFSNNGGITAATSMKRTAQQKTRKVLYSQPQSDKNLSKLGATQNNFESKTQRFGRPQPTISDIYVEFYEECFNRFGGDHTKTINYINKLKDEGNLQKILASHSFELQEIIQDQKKFAEQLDGQYGGASINELMGMQIDEFKVPIKEY